MLAECLAPLIDAGKASVELRAGRVPAEGLGIMDPFPLRLTVSIRRAAFSAEQSGPAARAE